MASTPEIVEFFTDFSNRSGDPAAVEEFFDDQFLSLDPHTSTLVRAPQLAAVLPARAAMFQSIGVNGTTLTNLVEHELDSTHRWVSTTWEARIDGRSPLTLSSSYLLRWSDKGWRIAVYLNHLDIADLIAHREAGSGAV